MLIIILINRWYIICPVFFLVHINLSRDTLMFIFILWKSFVRVIQLLAHYFHYKCNTWRCSDGVRRPFPFTSSAIHKSPFKGLGILNKIKYFCLFHSDTSNTCDFVISTHHRYFHITLELSPVSSNIFITITNF